MEKIENLEIKKYLLDFVIAKTQKSELFTKVFGKNFVRDRLATNLQTVYTNEFSRTKAGYHFANESSITLCTRDRNENKLSVEDLKADKQKLTTMLHEAIHAFLTKTEKECKKQGVKYATGILERYEDGKELGRGANEGLTNWICELLGNETESYKYETSFMKQLELALGKTRILKMGKGNISKNISRQLHMTKEQTLAFLERIDEVYHENDKLTQYNEYIYYLKKYANFQNLSDEESKETIAELSKLRRHPVIATIRITEDYQRFLKAAENPVEFELNHFQALIEQSEKQLKKSVANVESTIFYQYFKKKFQAMKKSENISAKDFELFSQLSELMLTDTSDDELKRYSSYNFLGEFEELYNKHFECIRNSAKRFYRHGELTFHNFVKLLEETLSMSENEVNIFISDISRMLYPENHLDFTMLFSYLIDNKQLYEAKRYSILNVAANGQNVPIVMKDGKPQCSWRLYKAKQLQETEETEEFLDFTLEMDEDYKNIINEFNTLKARAEARDPKATITIVDRAIFVQYGKKKQEVYLINNGTISVAKKAAPIPVQFQEDRAMIPSKSKAKDFRTKQKVHATSGITAGNKTGTPKQERSVDEISK